MYLWVGSITVQCLRAIRQVGKAANVVATFPSLDQKPKERVGCSKKLNCGVLVHHVPASYVSLSVVTMYLDLYAFSRVCQFSLKYETMLL